MTDLEQKLLNHGIAAEDVTFIVDELDEHTAELARSQASQLIRLIFLRVERDSAAGCALRRALGFSSEASLSRAARDFCVTKQYLHDVQTKLEAQLGPLSFLARRASEHDPAENSAGPSGEVPKHR